MGESNITSKELHANLIDPLYDIVIDYIGCICQYAIQDGYHILNFELYKIEIVIYYYMSWIRIENYDINNFFSYEKFTLISPHRMKYFIYNYSKKLANINTSYGPFNAHGQIGYIILKNTKIVNHKKCLIK